MANRIAHIMAGAQSGGAELFYERLITAQHKAYPPVLAIIRKNADRRKRLLAKGVQPVELRFGGVFDFKTQLQLKHTLAQFHPRVVVSWMNRATSFTPQGAWVHVGRLGGFYDLSYYRHCHHLVGNTKGIVKWLIEQGWPEKRAHYVPNFSYSLEGQGHRPSFIPSDVPFLLALGRLHTNKAFDVLMRAMADIPKAHLVIAGEGPERKSLENLARSLHIENRVHLPGWIDNTSSLMNACDILVCPSRHEPLGNVVIEAFSAKKPVVASTSQGPSELIENNKNGLLFLVDDSKALAHAVNKIIGSEDLKGQLALAGYEKYLAEFSEGHVLAQWQHFLEQVEKT